MYGAILGDIIGSPFEFDMGNKSKEFELFSVKSYFTDDTVMTIAVGEALMDAGIDASVEEIEKKVTASMQKWGHKYPDAGYGGRFYQWLHLGELAKPYHSYGNGSAMRVSAAGWLYNTVDRTREVAAATARVTHDHPEGIKGAEATASVIFLARNETSKNEIKKYVEKEFGYNLSRTLDEIRPGYHHVEDCMHTVPEAIIAFLEGKNFEDVIRNAVSLGGDTDTLAAIAGSMAEAFYGIPLGMIMRGEVYLSRKLLRVLERFDKMLDREPVMEISSPDDNRRIKRAVDAFYEIGNEDNFLLLRDTLLQRMLEDGQAFAPMRDENEKNEESGIRDKVTGNVKAREKAGDGLTYNREMHLVIDVVREQSGKEWIPMFTDEQELSKGKKQGVCVNRSIQDVLAYGLHDPKISGVVINPFGKSVVLNKELIEMLFSSLEESRAKQ